MRIELATCTGKDLFLYEQSRKHSHRQELIFAAGALDNRALRKELGSYEQSRWDEGRRAADPTYNNPYY